MEILLDPGHGFNTPGKRSPDFRLLEFQWNREMAAMVQAKLRACGQKVRTIVTEQHDVSLSERCRRVNEICAQAGASNCALVSIHVNAAGMGAGWGSASGWSGWVAKNASANSRMLAQLLYAEAEARGLKGNRFVPPCRYWEANYYILANTKCPAVLTENLFQDNWKEVDYLLSEAGKEAIADLHAQGILKYVKSF